MGDEIRLNIGAGDTVIEGFTPIDRKLGTEAYPLPQYADNSVAEIRASHVLEHFSFEDAAKVLAEWYRVLALGGKITISVPDVEKAAVSDHPQKMFYIMGGQTDENDFHRSAFNAVKLASFLREAGFSEIMPCVGSDVDTSASPFSLTMQAYKMGDTSSVAQIKALAIMSVPRVGWTDNSLAIQRALLPFKIPLRTFNGVFWGQCMERAFEEAIAAGIDWVITIDYDSMFTAEHLSRLIQDFGNTPEADAMFPLQVRRGSKYPLVTLPGEHNGRVGIDGRMLEAHTGHFGLTLIRVDALKKMSKPFFRSIPSENNDWNEGRTDEDIYFWLSLRQSGGRGYLNPNVGIGHIECMVAEFDHELNVTHTYVPDWRKREKLD